MMIREIFAVAVLLVLFAGFANAAVDFVPGSCESCPNMIDANNDRICDKFDSRDCGQGCQKISSPKRGCNGNCITGSR